MSTFTFEEFTARKGRFSPVISLAKSGGFAISAGFHHRYKIDKYKGLRLFFDKENKAVGIKFLEQEEAGMFKLKIHPNEKGGAFSAKSFLEAYAIDSKVYYGRYTPEEINDEKHGSLFVIKLQPHPQTQKPEQNSGS